MGEGFGGSNFQLEGVTRECMMRVREKSVCGSHGATSATNSGNHSSKLMWRN